MTDKAPKGKSGPGRVRSGLVRDLSALAVMFGLLLAVYLLPPDTALGEVRSSGRLSICMPKLYPPLITGDPAKPGFEVDVMQEVANRLGVRLMINSSNTMGQDFNPRNWRITRSQCQILAGGVVLSNTVRSFLDTTAGPLSTGWAVIAPQPLEGLDGAKVAVFSGLTGLDRIGLSRYLRSVGAEVSVMRTVTDLETAVRNGEVDAGIVEALSGQQLAAGNGWSGQWLPEAFERYRLGFGFWRGDITLLQAVEGLMADMERDGTMDALLERYDIVPITDVMASAPTVSQ